MYVDTYGSDLFMFQSVIVTVCNNTFSLLLRVENYTSENNELWKKVETLENANRWDTICVCLCLITVNTL